MFLNVAVETCNPLGGRLNKKPNDYRYVIIFHVEHENYYLYYFVFLICTHTHTHINTHAHTYLPLLADM